MSLGKLLLDQGMSFISKEHVQVRISRISILALIQAPRRVPLCSLSKAPMGCLTRLASAMALSRVDHQELRSQMEQIFQYDAQRYLIAERMASISLEVIPLSLKGAILVEMALQVVQVDMTFRWQEITQRYLIVISTQRKVPRQGKRIMQSMLYQGRQLL